MTYKDSEEKSKRDRKREKDIEQEKRLHPVRMRVLRRKGLSKLSEVEMDWLSGRLERL
jgi:hypothetical protein